MIRMVVGALAALGVSTGSVLAEEAAKYAKIVTSKGDITVALYPDKAPVTVENFLQYATKGHYDKTIVHRVVPGFVIQGGGYTRTFVERPTRNAIPYEGENGLTNKRGALAMARTSDPNSASSQWFINLVDNDRLNHRVTDLGPVYGYAVFGEVIEGLDVVDAIAAIPTGAGGSFPSEVPSETVIVERVDEIPPPAKP